MNITIYRSKDNPDVGYSIIESRKEIIVWIDEYEGGEASETDWMFDEEQPDFTSKDVAYNYIVDTYGEVELLDI